MYQRNKTDEFVLHEFLPTLAFYFVVKTKTVVAIARRQNGKRLFLALCCWEILHVEFSLTGTAHKQIDGTKESVYIRYEFNSCNWLGKVASISQAIDAQTWLWNHKLVGVTSCENAL